MGQTLSTPPSSTRSARCCNDHDAELSFSLPRGRRFRAKTLNRVIDRHLGKLKKEQAVLVPPVGSASSSSSSDSGAHHHENTDIKTDFRHVVPDSRERLTSDTDSDEEDSENESLLADWEKPTIINISGKVNKYQTSDLHQITQNNYTLAPDKFPPLTTYVLHEGVHRSSSSGTVKKENDNIDNNQESSKTDNNETDQNRSSIPPQSNTSPIPPQSIASSIPPQTMPQQLPNQLPNQLPTPVLGVPANLGWDSLAAAPRLHVVHSQKLGAAALKISTDINYVQTNHFEVFLATGRSER
jgi:hypothetical protein